MTILNYKKVDESKLGISKVPGTVTIEYNKNQFIFCNDEKISDVNKLFQTVFTDCKNFSILDEKNNKLPQNPHIDKDAKYHFQMEYKFKFKCINEKSSKDDRIIKMNYLATVEEARDTLSIFYCGGYNEKIIIYDDNKEEITELSTKLIEIHNYRNQIYFEIDASRGDQLISRTKNNNKHTNHSNSKEPSSPKKKNMKNIKPVIRKTRDDDDDDEDIPSKKVKISSKKDTLQSASSDDDEDIPSKKIKASNKKKTIQSTSSDDDDDERISQKKKKVSSSDDDNEEEEIDDDNENEIKKLIYDNFFPEDVSDNNKDTKSDETIKLQKKIHQFEEILSINAQPDENSLKIIDEKIKFHKNIVKIGEGATSVTYKITDTRMKVPICKKVIKYKKEQTAFKNAQNAIKEFEVMHSINHPCICKAFDINISEKIKIINEDNEEEEATTIAIFLEYVDYKLSDILNKKINNTSKTRIVLDIVHAMNFLHKKGMMHRDLKIDNIMINAFFETKLVDFGLVKISEIGIDGFSYVSDSLTRGIGTFAYMSPEMSNEEEYNNKTDVYSFGVILHFIFTGDLPEQSLKDKINGKKIDLPKPSKSISKFCIKLIDQCMSYSPSERPSFEEILNQMRENAYELASDVNPIIILRRDKELDFIENYK